MRLLRELWPHVSLLAWACCAACAPEPEIDAHEVLLQALPSCALPGATSLRVSALGDFAPRAEKLGFDDVTELTTFPTATRELAFSAELGSGKRALGLAPVVGGVQSEPAWLLPDQTSCPLGDPLAVVLPGAAVAALPQGGFLVAGGRREDSVVSTALVLGPGAQLAEPVTDGMLLRRSEATATLSGSVVLVAGGAADDTGSAQDTYELYVPSDAAFVRDRSERLQGGPRMQHGAALLPSGEVLLVGGRAEVDGEPLATAERIDPTTGRSVVLEASAGLSFARVKPDVLVLDDGRVLVIGGYDARGELVRVIERLSLDRKRFEVSTVELPRRSELQAAALPGGRVVVVACDADSDAACEIHLLSRDGASVDGVLQPVDFDAASFTPNGLRELRVLALFDGRALVTGRDPGAVVSSRALLLDAGRGTVERVAASRVPTALLTLRDGTIAELDAFGTSLRRHGLGSRYDAARGELADPGHAQLALDAASHWSASSDTLAALHDGARADLPGLQFANADIALEADGPVSLVLHDGRGASYVVQREASRLRLGKCVVSLAKSAELAVTRRGGRLAAGLAGQPAACVLEISDAALFVAVVAQAGTQISKWRVERR